VLGEKLKININPRVYYGAFDPKSIKEEASGNENLDKLFKNALAEKSGKPIAMNKDKFFHNQEERIQDEIAQAKADALRKGLLGGTLKNMMHH